MDLWHLFLIIFVETGLVVMPFLPGDSLLFAAGALAASTGAMDPWLLGTLLFIAAVLGDTVNYHIGRFIGPRVFEMNSRFINKQHLIKTQEFFARHGGKTIILLVSFHLPVPLHLLLLVPAAWTISFS